jgi:predicted nucleotidyltransferase component of viral defense system
MEARRERERRGGRVIPRDFITEWRSHAPWIQDAQVEQDLVISRAVVEIFRVPALADGLAFRGGTALYKLHLVPAARYSEDIDLVQITPEPIGNTLDHVRAVLDPWLGEPRRQLKEGRVNLVYRYDSEDQPPLRLRLKIEINSREHFTELGHLRLSYAVRSRWFEGEAEVTTYALEELLGTKLRALYQRKKGRDLFDLAHALTAHGPDPAKVVACFHRYLKEGGHAISRAELRVVPRTSPRAVAERSTSKRRRAATRRRS